MTDLISICICTHRRPDLQQTLESLCKLNPSTAFETEIVVVDNDAEPSAKSLVQKTAEQFGLTVNYVHAPKHNISIARNACLENAKGNLVAFIDDDEMAHAGWLNEVYNKMKKGRLQIVFGPVLAIYPEDCPEWIKRLDYHTARIKTPHPNTGHSGNVLIDMEHHAIKGRRFNPERGRTGGEDTQFFFECYKAGAKLGYSPSATVSENVRRDKLNFAWMRKSKYRSGLTYGFTTHSGTGLINTLLRASVSAAKVFYCFILSLLTLPAPMTSIRYFLRGFFHAGIFASNFNAKEEVLYGNV